MPTHITLYGTLGCHLCEDAMAVAMPLLRSHSIVIVEIDIAGNDALEERYGLRIPVACRQDTGAELGWPFDQASLLKLIEN